MLTIRHRITFEHQLLKSKCEKHEQGSLHKHTVWVFVKIYGDLNSDGYLQGHSGEQLDPAYAKKLLRDFLTNAYDGESYQPNRSDGGATFGTIGDPTYFYIAKELAEWATETFESDTDVEVVGDDEVSASYGEVYHIVGEENDGRESELATS